MREKISKARMRTPIAAVLAASLTAISAAQSARGDVKEVTDKAATVEEVAKPKRK